MLPGSGVSSDRVVVSYPRSILLKLLNQELAQLKFNKEVRAQFGKVRCFEGKSHEKELFQQTYSPAVQYVPGQQMAKCVAPSGANTVSQKNPRPVKKIPLRAPLNPGLVLLQS